MPALDLALPETYQGLKWVVLAVGMAFAAEASGGIAGPILQFSSRYKLYLPINLGLVLMTVASNYVFMSWLGWGIEGAALATGLTGIWNMGWRTSLMWRLFRIHPFTSQWIGVLILSVGVGSSSLFLPIPEIVLSAEPPWQVIYALLTGGVAGSIVLGGSWAMGGLPELTAEIQKRLPRS